MRGWERGTSGGETLKLIVGSSSPKKQARVFVCVCKFSMFIHTRVALEGTLSIVCLVCVSEAIQGLFSGLLGKCHSMAHIFVV